jgi:hypothetical protein
MMHTAATPKRSLEDALYILSIEKDIPDAAVLDKVIRAYPEFADELTDFAIDIAVDCFRNQPSESETSARSADSETVSPAVSRAMSRFQNRLHAVQTLPVSKQVKQVSATSHLDSGTKNPFQQLDRNGFRSLAARMGVNTIFVTKLRDRQIELSTIPAPFQSKLADEMNVPLELVIAHIGAPQAAPQGQFYKSVGKPQHLARQTFVEAVRGSGLSKDQQDALLGL